MLNFNFLYTSSDHLPIFDKIIDQFYGKELHAKYNKML
jgi:hypothetical protein